MAKQTWITVLIKTLHLMQINKMKNIFLLLILSVCIKATSQDTKKDSVTKAKNDSIRMAKLEQA